MLLIDSEIIKKTEKLVYLIVIKFLITVCGA